MGKRLLLLVVVLPNFLYSQSPPFQVLVAEKAAIYGTPVKPLQYIDDVTTIEVEEGGFLSLVHQGGTTYEITEKVFTFYLKPEELKGRTERPQIELLYNDSMNISSSSDGIKVIHPPVDGSNSIAWSTGEPLPIYWSGTGQSHARYKISLFYNTGGKIQDFGTTGNEFLLKPSTFGLSEPVFTFRVSSTLAGETSESESYTVNLKPSDEYPVKASDLVLKALDLDSNPSLALNVWEEALSMQNGNEYTELYEKFVKRNSKQLIAAGHNILQLLSKND